MPLADHTPAAEAAAHAELIVALDAGDLAGRDLDRAVALAASCEGCAALRDDLAAIRGALPAVPVPPRRRDFRLTEADAARLRPSGWGRLLGWLAAPGSTVRPLATGLATLGVVGLLLTAGLPGFGGGAATVTTDQERVEAPAAGGDGGAGEFTTTGPAAAPTGAPALEATEAPAPEATALPAPAATPVPGDAAAPDAPTAAPGSDRNAAGGGPAGAEDAKVTETGPPGGEGLPVGLLVSLVLLGSGIVLFVARALAVRRG